MAEESNFAEREEKAAYNQSQNITEFLGNLLGSYITHLNNDQLDQSIKPIERIVDIISPKIKEEELAIIDEKLEEVNSMIVQAMATYQSNGTLFWKNNQLRKKTKKLIVALFRYVNRLQDKYGYGMVSLDDPRFAVLNR